MAKVEVLLSISIISACSNSNNIQFLGLWQLDKPEINCLHVKANGDGYLVDVYERSMIDGSLEKKIFPATMKDATLVLDTPFAKTTALYSKDEKVIIIDGNKRYTKIEEVDETLAKINLIIQEQISDKRLCGDLQKELNEKKKLITNTQEWRKYLKKFHARVPKGCRVIGDSKLY